MGWKNIARTQDDIGAARGGSAAGSGRRGGPALQWLLLPAWVGVATLALHHWLPIYCQHPCIRHIQACKEEESEAGCGIS